MVDEAPRTQVRKGGAGRRPSWHEVPGGFCFSRGFNESLTVLAQPQRKFAMSAGTGQEHISKKRVVYTLPGMNDVSVRRDQEYSGSDSAPLTMDIYYPPGADRTPAPGVLFVTGFRDAGARTMLGCRFKEMAYISFHS
jgi:hypothetical protein